MAEVTFAQLVELIDSLGVPHQEHESDQVVVAALPGRQGGHLVLVRLLADREVVSLRAGGLAEVSADRRPAVGQAAGHVNARILLGAFSLDLTDGELVFDLPIPYGGVGIGAEQLGRCLASIAWTLDTFLPRLLRLAWTDEAVEDVLELPVPSPTRDMLRAIGQPDGPETRSA